MGVFDWITVAASISNFLNCFLLLYVAYFVMEDIESRLPNNRMVMDSKTIWKATGIHGRLYRIGILFFALLFASFWSKKKDLVDLEELNSLSAKDKFWIYAPMYITVVSNACLAYSLHNLGRL